VRVPIEEVADAIVEYGGERWRLLREKRARAVQLLEALKGLRARVVVHGSIARGDVRPGSDVDVVVLDPVPPDTVEYALYRAGLRAVYREIVQATPSYTPKVYFYLDHEGERVVSVPLARLRPREREFYRFGGELGLEGLLADRRVPGVTKDLVLVYPLPSGHAEISVVGREGLAARIVGVSIETVQERVRVLTTRRERGRTGVFVKEQVPPGVTVAETVERLARENPHFRQAISRL